MCSKPHLMKTIYNVCFIVLFVNFCTVSSKAKGIKYGKYSKEEIELTECSYEKGAVAVILSRTCNVDVNYSMIRYFYHVRIKILKEEGLKYADIELPFYRKDGIENISNVKGQTINFDADGKKMVSDLSGKSVFTVDVNENYGETRFGMPSVKVGSIIEYKYTLNSKFYSYLDTWYFQSDIPTNYSSIKVNIPESFRYNMVMFGDRVSLKYGNENANEWILTYLTSIKKEAYVNNYLDFVEQLRFQLAGYYKRDEMNQLEFVTALSSWEKLSRDYLSKIDLLGRKGFAKKKLEQILDGSENNWEKIEKVYDFVRTSLKWNKKYRIYPRQSPNVILEEKVASNSEINFLLVLLLRESGIDCDPALSRTNNLGLLQKEYPLMSQFNQVLACVKIYNKVLFLDATSPYRPYQLLSERDLNYYAFVLNKKNPRWEKIVPFSKSRQLVTLSYNLKDLDSPSCKLQVQELGYYAANTRREMTENSIEDRLRQVVDPSIFELVEDSVEVKNGVELSKPIIISANMPLDYEWDKSSDVIYFNVFPELSKKNPFLEETRQYRIDFNYLRYKSVVISVKIPDGYYFEEFPGSKTIKLPGDTGKFTFVSQKSNNELKFRTIFEIKNASFTKKFYSNFRELYGQMSKILNSQIVIKKDKNISEK